MSNKRVMVKAEREKRGREEREEKREGGTWDPDSNRISSDIALQQTQIGREARRGLT